MSLAGAPARAARPPTPNALVPTLLGKPIVLQAQGAWVTCSDGRRYLDAVAGPGVHALGHGHPRIIAAIEQQSRRLIHSSFQLNEPVLALADRLVELTGAHSGGRFQRVFFANSGSEAVEAAVKAAKKHSARRGHYGHGLVALEDGYHGRSGICLALTGMSIYKRGLPGFSLYPGVVHIAVPAAGRCPNGCSECGSGCFDDVVRTIDARLQDQLVAVIAEPVLGVGGVITPPAGFLRRLRQLCDARGALLIFDEVFTGFGRTGRMFAFEHSGVLPDILVVGKALGGGLPFGAFLASEEIGTCWEPIDHSTTFGGNVALTAAVGSAVVDEIVRSQLPESARDIGEGLLAALAEVAATRTSVADVRGAGLLIGIEFAGSDGMPWPERAAAFNAAMRARGVLTSSGGQHRSVVRLTPPLNLTPEEVAYLRDAAVSALAQIE